MAPKELTGIRYYLHADPRLITEIGTQCSEMNCRRAVQEWFGLFGVYLPPGLTLSEPAHQNLGEIVWDKDGESSDFSLIAKPGDVIFALPRFVNGSQKSLYTSEQLLHMAVYLGKRSSGVLEPLFPGDLKHFPPDMPLIFHATNCRLDPSDPVLAGIKPERKGVSAIWTVEELIAAYEPWRLRRLPAFEIALSHGIW